MIDRVAAKRLSRTVDNRSGRLRVRFHNKPYANQFPSILTYGRRAGKSVPAPGNWFDLTSKAKVADSYSVVREVGTGCGTRERLVRASN